MRELNKKEIGQLKEWLDRQRSVAIETAAGREDEVGAVFVGKADAYSQVIDWLDIHTEDEEDD